MSMIVILCKSFYNISNKKIHCSLQQENLSYRKVFYMPKLILCRHGQSEWNAKNLFTGWTDVDLSEQGINEAVTAGRKVKENNIEIDVAYTSLLKRALETTNYILKESDQLWIPVHKSWRLNERHYGKLQGLNKDDARKEFGEEQVHKWRRSYDIEPPAETEAQREEYLQSRKYRQQQARYDENGNRYYNDRDFRREQQLEEDNIRQKKSKKWLYIIIALLLIVVAVFVTLAFMGGDSNSDKVSNDPNVSQNYQKQVKDKDDSITSQIEAAKNDIKDKVNTDNTIQKLQQEINSLKQNEQNNADSKFTKFYQDQLDKLKNANQAQQNNADQSKVEGMLDDINTKFDSLKDKIENFINSFSGK